MAATTKPSSPWVSSYSDKSDEWVLARLEIMESRERVSLAGSIPRRKEIRELRVERRKRQEAATAAAAMKEAAAAPLNGGASSGPVSANSQLVAQASSARR